MLQEDAHLLGHKFNMRNTKTTQLNKDKMIDELQELELKQSMTSVQSVEGFKFKTSLYHGVRNFELIDESKKSGKEDVIDESLDYFDLESKTHFLGEPSRYLREEDALRHFSISSKSLSNHKSNKNNNNLLGMQNSLSSKFFFNPTQ